MKYTQLFTHARSNSNIPLVMPTLYMFSVSLLRGTRLWSVGGGKAARQMKYEYIYAHLTNKHYNVSVVTALKTLFEQLL